MGNNRSRMGNGHQSAPSQEADQINTRAAPSRERDQINARAAQSRERDQISARAAPSREPDQINTGAAPNRERNQINVRAAQSREPDQINARAAPSRDLRDQINARAAQSRERDQISARAAPSRESDQINPQARNLNSHQSAPSREPNQINARAQNLNGQEQPTRSDRDITNMANTMTGSVVSESILSNRSSTCVRFLENRCPNDALSCPYSHTKDGAPLCEAWKRGLCFYDHMCLGRHYYLERDSIPPVQMPPKQTTGNIDYSSPLVVKVRTLQEKHRREEVDLETGRRRSWIETENKELIDITGVESPVALPNKLTSEDENASMEINENLKGANPGNASKCMVCGRKFKGERGVKSHLSHPHSKCGKALAAVNENLD